MNDDEIAVAPVSAVLYASTFVEWQVFAVLAFSFLISFFRFHFQSFFYFLVLVFIIFLVLVLVFVNEFIIFSFFVIVVFVNENHTDLWFQHYRQTAWGHSELVGRCWPTASTSWQKERADRWLAWACRSAVDHRRNFYLQAVELQWWRHWRRRCSTDIVTRHVCIWLRCSWSRSHLPLLLNQH